MRVLKSDAPVSKRELWNASFSGPLSSIGRQRVGAFQERACLKKKMRLKVRVRVQGGNRLPVGVRPRNASAPGGQGVGHSTMNFSVENFRAFSTEPSTQTRVLEGAFMLLLLRATFSMLDCQVLMESLAEAPCCCHCDTSFQGGLGVVPFGCSLECPSFPPDFLPSS